RRRPARRRLLQAHPRRQPRRGRPAHARAPRRGHGRGRGPRRPRRLRPPAGRAVKRPPVRDDLALHPGYHSPQVEVDVRLNTNEAPEAPPEGFREALAAELATVDWHRYPDRAATELREAIAAHHGVS